MTVEFDNGYKKTLYMGPEPFIQAVNNGFLIETQDVALFDELEADEKRKDNPVDWCLFKPGETILIDNIGRSFVCTCKNDGYVRLEKIL